MEQPVHNLRAHMNPSAGEAAPRRIGGLVIVVLLHVGIVAGLVLGLKAGEIAKKMEDIKVAVEKEKVQPKLPPPPPPAVKLPPPVVAPPPLFDIQSDAPAQTTITTSPPRPPAQVAPNTPPAPPPTKFEPIKSTITKPDYPELSLRLREQGTTNLTLTISIDGHVSDAVVSKSSGYTRLDDAAVQWVKTHWRFKPPTQEGKPVDGHQVTVPFKWVLPE